MNFLTVVNNISTSNELKRTANAYVIDFRSLNREELTTALIKTAPQYYHKPNVESAIKYCLFHENRVFRTLIPVFLKHIMLNKDDFKREIKLTNEDIIKFEQNIINKSNEFVIGKNNPNKESLELFHFILEVAWEHQDNISVDEKNLIVKIQKRLSISEEEYMILEAQLGKFPKPKNILHSNDEINMVRRELQRLGLLFSIRDDDGIDYDIIPIEIANVLKEIYDMEMKTQGYERLISNKRFRTKEYMAGIIERSGISSPKNMSLKNMKDFVMNKIKPSNLLGGFSSRDGFNSSELNEWCKELNINYNRTKDGLIRELIEYYDGFKEKPEEQEDFRNILFDNYSLLAGRKTEELRLKGLIEKDLECERYFEKATDYLFETLLNVEPLDLIGNEHPDGILSFNDKLIMWDNKSKETEVNLKDHINQFDRYIHASVKPVASFLVIGPSFTPNSIDEAVKYQLLNDTVITLVTAEQLKELSIKWSETKGKEPFPLGYFKQPGKFNSKLIMF
ncbi:hypothetical protein RJI07_00615 [Mycoplasmatota bacterium WC30]